MTTKQGCAEGCLSTLLAGTYAIPTYEQVDWDSVYEMGGFRILGGVSGLWYLSIEVILAKAKNKEPYCAFFT